MAFGADDNAGIGNDIFAHDDITDDGSCWEDIAGIGYLWCMVLKLTYHKNPPVICDAYFYHTRKKRLDKWEQRAYNHFATELHLEWRGDAI